MRMWPQDSGWALLGGRWGNSLEGGGGTGGEAPQPKGTPRSHLHHHLPAARAATASCCCSCKNTVGAELGRPPPGLRPNGPLRTAPGVLTAPFYSCPAQAVRPCWPSPGRPDRWPSARESTGPRSAVPGTAGPGPDPCTCHGCPEEPRSYGTPRPGQHLTGHEPFWILLQSQEAFTAPFYTGGRWGDPGKVTQVGI